MWPSTFEWESAALSSFRAPLTGAVIYLLVVAALDAKSPRVDTRPLQVGSSSRRAPRRRLTFSPPSPRQAYHNLVLCAMSLVMFLGGLFAVAQRSADEGGLWLLCEHQSTPATGAVYYWSYMYYLSKYYELLDTVLQVRAPLPSTASFRRR